ncbi:MAG: hypothetical protein V4857_26730 [Pseudomonadota bacterium]
MRHLQWSARAAGGPPPGGLVAAGAVARRVLLALRGYTDEHLQSLSMVATRDLLVVLGANDALPWVDGVRYCAPDPLARGLWLPTHQAPQLPLDLVQANLVARGARIPMLLWNEPEQVLPLDAPTVLNQAVLAWLERELD